MLSNLWRQLTRRRQIQFFYIFILMILSSLSEIISIGSVLPFLGALTAPEQVFNLPITQSIVNTLELSTLTEPQDIVLPLTIIFIILTFFAGIIRLTLLYAVTRFSYATAADLSNNIYKRTLYQDYSVHISRNSSEVINGIITKTGIVTSTIRSVLTLLSSFVLIIGVVSILLTIDKSVAMISFIVFGGIYGGIIWYTRIKLHNNSEIISNKSNLMVKSLQEGLGGIRDVLIDGSQKFFANIYRSADHPFRRAVGTNVFIGQSPRYAMEAIGITLIAVLAFIVMHQNNSSISAIPVLGAMALGAQKLLPILQQGYGSFSNIKSGKSSFKDVLALLDQPLPSYADEPSPVPIKFEKTIQLSNLDFRYSEDSPWVLKNLNLKINKCSQVGFIGATGSGKSTLIDIILGLIAPTKGLLLIDNQDIDIENKRAWQAHIAHVPQNIFLADASIEENIAFGVPKSKINHERVKEAAEKAQISELIEGWKNTYLTNVGEDGARISGGQRQRIGIARALYKNADVLIFDEATSSLDTETEKEVIRAIVGLKGELTILIIAHRLSSLKDCDLIVKLDKDNSVKTGSFNDMVNSSL